MKCMYTNIEKGIALKDSGKMYEFDQKECFFQKSLLHNTKRFRTLKFETNILLYLTKNEMSNRFESGRKRKEREHYIHLHHYLSKNK